MERIKNLDEVVPQGSNIWAEVKVKKDKSIIIDPNKPLDIDYIEVKSVGQYVTDVEPGDFILEFTEKYTPKHIYDIKGKTYIQIPRNVCFTIVKKDNFNSNS